MADVFEWDKALSEWRAKLWHVIEKTPNLDWLLPTKRPHLVRRLMPWNDHWPNNVWLGTTAEDQAALKKRLPFLVENPSRIRFLSCEPLLDAMDLTPDLASDSVQWMRAARMHVRMIRNGCVIFGTHAWNSTCRFTSSSGLTGLRFLKFETRFLVACSRMVSIQPKLGDLERRHRVAYVRTRVGTGYLAFIRKTQGDFTIRL